MNREIGTAHAHLIIREPRESELGVCRMLLPETASTPMGRIFRLAFESTEGDSPRIAGALSYVDDGATFSGLRLHVVKNRRRSRIGSRLIEYLVAEAHGRERIFADADIKNEPDAEPFLTATGFRIAGRVTSVESELAAMLPKSHLVTDRLAAAQGFPEGSRVVPLEEAPLNQIIELFTKHVAELPMMAALFRNFRTEDYPDSVVLMQGEQVIAFLLSQVKDGVWCVPAWVTRPEFRGQRLGLRLLPALGERMRARLAPGTVKRVRFDFADAATFTAKLAFEYECTVVRIAARFERLIDT